LGVGLQVLERPGHARLGQKVAHGGDVAVGTVGLDLLRRGDALD
jgi:hypothetical protein